MLLIFFVCIHAQSGAAANNGTVPLRLISDIAPIFISFDIDYSTIDPVDFYMQLNSTLFNSSVDVSKILFVDLAQGSVLVTMTTSDLETSEDIVSAFLSPAGVVIQIGIKRVRGQLIRAPLGEYLYS